jgi:valyl-tRNA synthetase
LSPADRWILARTRRVIERVTDLYAGYNYAAAKSETEDLFWRDLADNYLEMAKLRLYEGAEETRQGAIYTLYHTLLATLKLLAPILFAKVEGSGSIHTAGWPQPGEIVEVGDDAEAAGERLVAIATAVRRWKTEHDLPLGTPLQALQLATPDPGLAGMLQEAGADLMSITRAKQVQVTESPGPAMETLLAEEDLVAALTP